MPSEDPMNGIHQLLEQELRCAYELEERIGHLQKQLLLCKGRVSAYQGLLGQGPTARIDRIGRHADTDSNQAAQFHHGGGGRITSSSAVPGSAQGEAGFPERSRASYNTNNLNSSDGFSSQHRPEGPYGGPKRRAQRAPKLVMEQRKTAVIRAFFQFGDCSPKEIESTVNAELGYELASHRLRAVLKKFKSIFENKPTHGIWGLTEEAKRRYAELNPLIEAESVPEGGMLSSGHQASDVGLAGSLLFFQESSPQGVPAPNLLPERGTPSAAQAILDTQSALSEPQSAPADLSDGLTSQHLRLLAPQDAAIEKLGPTETRFGQNGDPQVEQDSSEQADRTRPFEP